MARIVTHLFSLVLSIQNKDLVISFLDNLIVNNQHSHKRSPLLGVVLAANVMTPGSLIEDLPLRGGDRVIVVHLIEDRPLSHHAHDGGAAVRVRRGGRVRAIPELDHDNLLAGEVGRVEDVEDGEFLARTTEDVRDRIQCHRT